MNAPLIVVFPRGQLHAEDKIALKEAGIVAIEADDPKQVHQLHLAAPLISTAISGDAVVKAALAAIARYAPETPGGSINSVGRAAHDFVKMISESLSEQKGAA